MIEIADSRVGGVVPALWLLALQNAINTTAASWGEVIEFKGCRCVTCISKTRPAPAQALTLLHTLSPAAAACGHCRPACRPASRTEFVALSVGAQDKRKRYAAVCWCSEPRSPAQMQALLAARKDVKVRAKGVACGCGNRPSSADAAAGHTGRMLSLRHCRSSKLRRCACCTGVH